MMKTYPSGVKIEPVATYYSEETGVTITVSKRSGGIGRPDYLVAGPGGFSATCQTLDKATETALRELARLAATNA